MHLLFCICILIPFITASFYDHRLNMMLESGDYSGLPSLLGRAFVEDDHAVFSLMISLDALDFESDDMRLLITQIAQSHFQEKDKYLDTIREYRSNQGKLLKETEESPNDVVVVENTEADLTLWLSSSINDYREIEINIPALKEEFYIFPPREPGSIAFGMMKKAKVGFSLSPTALECPELSKLQNSRSTHSWLLRLIELNPSVHGSFAFYERMTNRRLTVIRFGEEAADYPRILVFRRDPQTEFYHPIDGIAKLMSDSEPGEIIISLAPTDLVLFIPSSVTIGTAEIHGLFGEFTLSAKKESFTDFRKLLQSTIIDAEDRQDFFLFAAIVKE